MNPAANIGMPADGLIVVDCDVPKNEGDEDGYINWLAIQDKHSCGQMVSTATQETPSGGIHYFFKGFS